MHYFDEVIDIAGHEVTMRLLDDIIEVYQKACFATGKRVEQPHLKNSAKKAIQALSPFYSEGDAERLLARAVAAAPASKKPVTRRVA